MSTLTVKQVFSQVLRKSGSYRADESGRPIAYEYAAGVYSECEGFETIADLVAEYGVRIIDEDDTESVGILDIRDAESVNYTIVQTVEGDEYSQPKFEILFETATTIDTKDITNRFTKALCQVIAGNAKDETVEFEGDSFAPCYLMDAEALAMTNMLTEYYNSAAQRNAIEVWVAENPGDLTSAVDYPTLYLLVRAILSTEPSG